MNVEFTTLVGIDYSGNNLIYQHIVKYQDFYISHIALQLQNYSYIYSNDLSPFSIDSDKYRIDFNSTAQYDSNSLIYIIDKRYPNAPTTKLSVSTGFIESIRDHVLENRRLNINERQAGFFEGLLPAIDNRLNYERNVNVQQYNINQMLNSGPAVRSTQNRTNIHTTNITDPTNNQTINPTNNNDPVEIKNQNGSGLRKTKKKQRKNKRKTRIRK